VPNSGRRGPFGFARGAPRIGSFGEVSRPAGATRRLHSGIQAGNRASGLRVMQPPRARAPCRSSDVGQRRRIQGIIQKSHRKKTRKLAPAARSRDILLFRAILKLRTKTKLALVRITAMATKRIHAGNGTRSARPKGIEPRSEAMPASSTHLLSNTPVSFTCEAILWRFVSIIYIHPIGSGN
jgi:hypothetical protein